MSGKPLLRLTDTIVGYEGRPVLGPVSFSLLHGRSCLVVGPNGSGKSTLLRSIVGLRQPISGSVNVLQRLVRPGSLEKLVPAGVRYLGQGDRGFGQMRTSSQRAILEKLYGLHRSQLPLGVSRRDILIKELSVGQRRLEALNVLDFDPALLFLLDEPMAGLDETHRAQVIEWIKLKKSRGSSLVLVEHKYEDIMELFDDILAISSRGEAYFGPMITQEEILERSV